MEANELRIGNYVMWQNTLIHIETHNLFNRTLQKINEDRCNPVPLTEEWLLKFGFISDEITFELNGFMLGQYKDNHFYYLPTNQINLRHKNQIKYVHQLQNLYFALSGKEIILNNNFYENK